jgi:hypothetical protein
MAVPGETGSGDDEKQLRLTRNTNNTAFSFNNHALAHSEGSISVANVDRRP